MSNLKYVNSVTNSLADQREFIDDIIKGSVGIQDGGMKYLPQEANEENASYLSRLSKATYFDSFNPTINGISGLLFKSPITYSEDVPTQLAPLIENADMQGNHLDIIIEKMFKKALQKGISFCLIDIPKGKAESKTEEKALGLRPYLTLVEPENITSWKTERINGQIVLSQVKIKEFAEEEDSENPYATKSVEQYRILERGSFKVYRLEDGKETLVDQGETMLDFVSLVALNLNSQGFFNATPPFYDLGKMNISHYQIFADSRYSAHVASVPFYFGAGLSPEDTKGLIISPNTFFSTHDSSASINIVDYKGDGVAVNSTLLDRIETRMREEGLSVISQDKTVTATEVGIASAQSQSKLNGYTRLLIDAVNVILRMCAMVYGKDNGGSIGINADILSQPLTSQEVVILNNMVISGNMSLDTMYNMIASGTFRLPNGFDIEAEKEKIGENGLLTDDTGE